jgi:hypothetical protein
MATPRRFAAMATRQRGWAGLIGLLIALLIVAWLGRTLITKLLPAPATVVTTKGRVDGARAPGGVAPGDVDATSATPVPRNELERARGLESDVRRQAAELEQRIDKSTQ